MTARPPARIGTRQNPVLVDSDGNVSESRWEQYRRDGMLGPDDCPFHHLPFAVTVQQPHGAPAINAAEACERWHENGGENR